MLGIAGEVGPRDTSLHPRSLHCDIALYNEHCCSGPKTTWPNSQIYHGHTMETNLYNKHAVNVLVMLVGPSTAGKTDVAIGLAKRLPGEIINADKFYLYQGFPSTTGLPDFTMSPTVSSHLYGILSPETDCPSEQEYVSRVLEVIGGIESRGSVPIIEGCYYRFANALLNGVDCRRRIVAGIKWPPGTHIEERVAGRIHEIFHQRGGINEVRKALRDGHRNTYVMRKGSMVKPLVECIDGEITLEMAKEKAQAEILSSAYKAYRKFLDLPGIEWYENDATRLPHVIESIAKHVQSLRGERL